MVIVLLFCLGLRLIGLNQSLWLDEAVSANVVKNLNTRQIINDFSPRDFHPPFYYLILKWWTNIFGYSEIALRMPSVIFSLVTIFLIYRLAGKWAAILTGLNPLLVYYAQEARMYSMVVMLLTAAMYSWGRKKILAFNFFCFLAFLTFYGSLFLIMTMLICIGIKQGWSKAIKYSWGIILAIILVLPLVREQISNSKTMLIEVKNWTLVLGKATIKNLLLIPIKFSVGRISFYPKIIYWIISGAWTMLVFGSAMVAGIKNKIWLAMLVMSLALGVIFSGFSPMMQYFRFLYLVPILAIILARTSLKKITSIGFLGFSLLYLLNPKYHREDWKSLAKDLGNKVYIIKTVADGVRYYRPEVEIVDIRGKILEKEVEVIPYAEEVHGFNHGEELAKQGYRQIEARNYRGLGWEKWSRLD